MKMRRLTYLIIFTFLLNCLIGCNPFWYTYCRPFIIDGLQPFQPITSTSALSGTKIVGGGK